MPVDDDSLVLSLTERNSCYPLAIIMACTGGGIDRHITAWLAYSCTFACTCMVDMIFLTNFVCALFGPPIPTLSHCSLYLFLFFFVPL